MPSSSEHAAENIAKVLESMRLAAEQADRDPADIQLVAVSKTHSAADVRTVLTAGHRVFGENRVQEAQDKWPDLKAEFPDAQLHLIGPLQSNKARAAVDLFDAIETVDRPKLARALARHMAEAERRPDLFIQVNTGNEPQKAGVSPGELAGLLALCRDELALPVIGLMCIPPQEEEPSLHFAFLRELAHRHGLAHLSMGMSADYGMAIQFGATSVRVGSAIFGARQVYADDG